MKGVIILFKYGGVAAASACVDWFVFALLGFVGLQYLPAQMSSRIAGGAFSFFANKCYSFSLGRSGRIVVQGRRFLLLYAASYALAAVLMSVLIGWAALDPYISKIIVDTTCLFFNYAVMNIYVYKSRQGVTEGVQQLWSKIFKPG